MATDYNVLGPFNSCMGDRMKTQKDWRARPDGHGGYWWWHRKYPHIKNHLQADKVSRWPESGVFDCNDSISQRALSRHDGRAAR